MLQVQAFRIRHGALHALVLVALAACGTADPPAVESGAPRAGAELRLPKTFSVTLEPTGPHYLLPTEGFGKSVALSGARVAVADYLNWQYSTFRFPHVDTFEIVNGVAVATGKLPAEGYGELCFGEALALAGDLLAVGEPCANAGAGEVHVYARVGTTWVEEPVLAAPGGAESRFGGAIALAANRMVIGAPGEGKVWPEGAYGRAVGAAYVYTRAGAGWRASARVTPSDGQTNDGFGGALAMDASRFVATSFGRWNGDAAGNAIGANGKGYLFTLAADGTWSETATFVVGDGLPGEWTGRTVALCSETVFMGSETWAWPAVHLFQEGPEGWTEGDLDDPTAPPNGYVDAMGCDGPVLAVGMPFSTGPAGEAWMGSARRYSKLGGAWLMTGEVTGAAEGDRAGHAVAVDGSVFAVGIPAAMVDGRALGTVRVERF